MGGRVEGGDARDGVTNETRESGKGRQEELLAAGLGLAGVGGGGVGPNPVRPPPAGNASPGRGRRQREATR